MASDASTASPSVTGASRVKSSEMIQLLSSLGVEANTATVMVYLHTHAQTTSSDLQKK